MAKNPLPKILLEILGVVVVIVAVYFGAGLDQTTSGGHAGMRMDPGTGIEFPLSKSFDIGGGQLLLAGVGTRAKAAVVKIYGAGYYASEKVLKEAATKSGGKGVAKEVIKGGGTQAVVLTFAMGIGAGKVAEALSGVGGVAPDVITTFQKLLLDGMGGSMKKGESMTLEFGPRGEVVLVTVRGKKVGEMKDKALHAGLKEMYLGAKPVSQTLVRDMDVRVPQIEGR
uniref:Chalcone isomerase domain-containing protein n=1 Tax=Florenciella parvula TaxID=236787 RepID=A0A7S2CCW4_9STRA|mmetsp:Transcript_26832/g.55195  ORF Transcript_26832/g.55195 Transcript_26832/m.55195 type:complete len:226 (+) Transcript_26832:92-769(+)